MDANYYCGFGTISVKHDLPEVDFRLIVAAPNEDIAKQIFHACLKEKTSAIYHVQQVDGNVPQIKPK